MGEDSVSIEMLAAWPVLVLILIWVDRRHGRMPLFIVYSYIGALAVTHWFGALVHVVPPDWGHWSHSAMDTPEGFRLATWGLAFLVAGAAVYPRVRSVNSQQWSTPTAAQAAGARRAVNISLMIGLASWIAALTPLASVPSVSAAISGGQQFLVGAICLKCWLAWTSSDRRRLFLWLAVGFMFPVYTVLFEGFLGFGISYLLSILIFVGTFYRPRWRVLASGVVAVYAGLSLYIGYIENRTQLRAAVWSGQPMDVRLNAVSKMVDDIAPFDPLNPRHRLLVDLRLNQNWLVGASMHYVPEYHSYAYGETLYDAFFALVPRVIWPDKPYTGGSGNLASEYSGIRFAEGTSVGIGQVMEFYVNLGWLGVAAGFFLLGYGLRYVDLRVSTNIRDQDWSNAGLWFAVGLSAMQPGGQLAEVTSSMAAAAVFGIAARKMSQAMAQRDHARLTDGSVRSRSAMPFAQPPGAPGARRLVDRPERNLS
jgi:hypothetical protein